MPESEGEKPVRPEDVLGRQVADRFAQRISEIRGRIAALERELQDRLDAEATIQIVLAGEGGGEWFVNVRGGEAKVGSDPAGEPVLSIHQSIDDFCLAASQGAAGGIGFGGPGGQGDLTKTRISRLQSIRGTIQFKVTDLPGGREMPVTIHFGPGNPAAEPQTVIAIKAEDALKLRKGELNPQTAFLQGSIRIAGDAALAMQVGMAMM